jgi:hypothetical protein
VIGTSDGWAAEKPSAVFFERLIVEAGGRAEAVLHVGDRLDNDMTPAQRLGIHTAVLRRGPWGFILYDKETLDRCLFRLDSLDELPDLVAEHDTRRPDYQAPDNTAGAKVRNRSATRRLSGPPGSRLATSPMR